MAPHDVLRDSPRFIDLIGAIAASLPSEMPKKLTPLAMAMQANRDLKNELHSERTTGRQALLEDNRRLQVERDGAVARAESATRELAAYSVAFSALVSLWHVIGTGKE